MDEVDKDVANLLGIDPQELETCGETPSPKRTRTAPGIGAAVVALIVTVSLSSLALLQMKRTTTSSPPARVASAQKLDVFLDRSTSRERLQSGGATSDLPQTSAVPARLEKKTIRLQRTVASPHSGRSATLRLARAERTHKNHLPTAAAPSPPVDISGESGTVANLGVEKTLVSDRLEAIDSLRLLHQR